MAVHVHLPFNIKLAHTELPSNETKWTQQYLLKKKGRQRAAGVSDRMGFNLVLFLSGLFQVDKCFSTFAIGAPAGNVDNV